MDLISAKESMLTLLKDPQKCLLLNAENIVFKSYWSTQIAGIYSMLYPHIENNFPRRDETQVYVNAHVASTMMAHCLTPHDAQQEFLGTYVPVVTNLLNMERVFPVKDGEDTFFLKDPMPEVPELNPLLYTKEALAIGILVEELEKKAMAAAKAAAKLANATGAVS